MSIPVTVLPGTLPTGYCYPDDPQEFNVDIVTRIVAFLNTVYTGVYASPTEPPADERDKVWFNTVNQRLYWYINGAWQRKYEPWASSSRLIMIEADIDTFNAEEGGDATGVAVGDSVGPLWELATEYVGRVPIGVGLIPGSAPASTLALGDTGGEAQHALTEAEGAVGQHIHPFGLSHAGNDDAYFKKAGAPNTVPGYTGYYITGSDGNIETPETTADLYTSPSGNDGAGVTAAAHTNLQPYKAVNFARRTARIYVSAPY